MATGPRRVTIPPTTQLVALLVVALALRPQVAAIGPLADSIIADLGTSHAFVGLLTTIPVLCMGLFALVGPSLARIVGVRAGIAASVGTLVLFAILRTLVPGAVPLLVLTVGVGVGMGVIGPILPMFVRGRTPGHMVAGTASYAAGIIIGAAVASGIVVPLASLAGGWREALLVVSLASGLAVVAWVALVHRMPGPRPQTGPRAGPPVPASGARAIRDRVELPRLPLRRPVAWAIGILFAMQSWLYYGTTAWLVSVYVERGWDPAPAAGLLTLVSAASLTAIVGVPYLSRRGAPRRVLLVAAATLSCAGLLGVAALAEPAVAWAVLVGTGLGMTFTLVLTLPTDIGDAQDEVGGAAALMLLVGYLLASVAPFVLGAVRDATGDFVAGLWLLVVIAGVMVPLAWSLAPHRLRPAPRP